MLAWQMLSSDCLKHLLYQKRRRLADPRSEHLNLLLNVCKAAPVLEAHLQMKHPNKLPSSLSAWKVRARGSQKALCLNLMPATMYSL